MHTFRHLPLSVSCDEGQIAHIGGTALTLYIHIQAGPLSQMSVQRHTNTHISSRNNVRVATCTVQWQLLSMCAVFSDSFLCCEFCCVLRARVQQQNKNSDFPYRNCFTRIWLLGWIGIWVPQAIMGKLNVSILRYLTKEDFRVLTAVSVFVVICWQFDVVSHRNWSYKSNEYRVTLDFRLKWEWKITNWYRPSWQHRLPI